jgi:large subunit ribosomal protein L21e
MPKSKGYRRKTRRLLSKKKGMVPLTRLLYTYEKGQSVVIDIDPSQPKGMPHRRYQGKVGKVREVRKHSLIVDVKVGGKTKKVIARFEHVKPFKW